MQNFYDFELAYMQPDPTFACCMVCISFMLINYIGHFTTSILLPVLRYVSDYIIKEKY